MQQVKQAKKAEKEKSEWDRSTVISEVPRTLEDKVASRIANQMLKENPQFKGIHSNMSIKKILEKEAKRQLLEETGGQYQPPIISKVPTHERNTRTDPSNLPYLHKCPAVWTQTIRWTFLESKGTIWHFIWDLKRFLYFICISVY